MCTEDLITKDFIKDMFMEVEKQNDVVQEILINHKEWDKLQVVFGSFNEIDMVHRLDIIKTGFVGTLYGADLKIIPNVVMTFVGKNRTVVSINPKYMETQRILNKDW